MVVWCSCVSMYSNTLASIYRLWCRLMHQTLQISSVGQENILDTFYSLWNYLLILHSNLFKLYYITVPAIQIWSRVEKKYLKGSLNTIPCRWYIEQMINSTCLSVTQRNVCHIATQHESVRHFAIWADSSRLHNRASSCILQLPLSQCRTHRKDWAASASFTPWARKGAKWTA